MRRAATWLFGLVAHAWLLSLRLVVVESPALAAAGGRPRALAFWHGQQFALVRWARGRRLAALVSRSRDGALVAEALHRAGVATARGSSSRGGASALRAMVRALRSGFEAAFAVDGPKGPRGVVRASRVSSRSPLRVARCDHRRAGVALAAELAGGVVVPLASSASSKIVLRSWDRFEIALPFSRVAVVLGAPLEPADATPEAIAAAVEAARAEAERLIAPASVPVDALLQVRGDHPA